MVKTVPVGGLAGVGTNRSGQTVYTYKTATGYTTSTTAPATVTPSQASSIKSVGGTVTSKVVSSGGSSGSSSAPSGNNIPIPAGMQMTGTTQTVNGVTYEVYRNFSTGETQLGYIVNSTGSRASGSQTDVNTGTPTYSNVDIVHTTSGGKSSVVVPAGQILVSKIGQEGYINIQQSRIPEYNALVDKYNKEHPNIYLGVQNNNLVERLTQNQNKQIVGSDRSLVSQIEQRPQLNALYPIQPEKQKGYEPNKLVGYNETEAKAFATNKIIDYSPGELAVKQYGESEKIIGGNYKISEKIGAGTAFLGSATDVFDPMKDFEKAYTSKGGLIDVQSGLIGLAKTPSYVVGVAGTTLGGIGGFLSGVSEYAGAGYRDTGKNLALYYGVGTKEFTPLKVITKTPYLVGSTTKNLVISGTKIVVPAITVGAAVVGTEIGTGFPTTRMIIGETIKEATTKPIKFATEMVLLEGVGKGLKGLTNIGALSSKSVLVPMVGRGTKYAINGKAVSKLAFNEASLMNTIKYDILRLSKPVVTKAPKGMGFVEGAVAQNAPTLKLFKSGKGIKISQQVGVKEASTLEKFVNTRKVMVTRVKEFNLLKPSTYVDALSGKKPGQFKNIFYSKKKDLILLDTPSEMIGKEIVGLGGKTTVGISVSPGKGTPFAKKFLKLGGKEYTVKEMPGTSILRQFGGGVEKGQFFAPKTTKSTILVYEKTQSKIPFIRPELGDIKSFYTAEKQLNLEKLISKAKTKVVSPLSKGIPNKNEFGLIEKIAKNKKDIALSGSAGEQAFTLKNLKAADVDLISTNAKGYAKLFVKEGQQKGLKVSLSEAKHKGTYNVLIGGKPRIQISQTKVIGETINVEGISVSSPRVAIPKKFKTIGDPLQAFRAEKDLSRLQALVKGEPRKEYLLKKVNDVTPHQQAYVYYAGVGREPELIEALKTGSIGWGKSPKMLVEEQKVFRLSKDLQKSATREEVGAIKKEFAERFAFAKRVESGLVDKPIDFLSKADLDILLKRGSYEQYAVYRRLTAKLNIPGTVQPGVGAISGLRTELETIKAAGGVSKKVQLGSGIRSSLSKVFDIGEVQVRYAPTGDVFGTVFQKNVPLTKSLAKKVSIPLSKATKVSDDWLFKASKGLSKVSDGAKPVYSISKRFARVGGFVGAGLLSASRGISKVGSGVSKISLGSGRVQSSLGSSFSKVSSGSVFGKSSNVPNISSSVSGGKSLASPSISASSVSISSSVSMPKVSSSLSSGKSVSSGFSSAKISLGSSSMRGRSVSGSSFSSRVSGGFSSGGSFSGFSSGFSSGGGSSGGGSSGGGSSITSNTSFNSFKSSFSRMSSKTPSFKQPKYSLLKTKYPSFREPKISMGSRIGGKREVNLLQRKENFVMPKQNFSSRNTYADKMVFNESKGMKNKSNLLGRISNNLRITNKFKKANNLKSINGLMKGMFAQKNSYSQSNDYSVKIKGYSNTVKYRDTDLINTKEIL